MVLPILRISAPITYLLTSADFSLASAQSVVSKLFSASLQFLVLSHYSIQYHVVVHQHNMFSFFQQLFFHAVVGTELILMLLLLDVIYNDLQYSFF